MSHPRSWEQSRAALAVASQSDLPGARESGRSGLDSLGAVGTGSTPTPTRPAEQMVSGFLLRHKGEVSRGSAYSDGDSSSRRSVIAISFPSRLKLPRPVTIHTRALWMSVSPTAKTCSVRQNSVTPPGNSNESVRGMDSSLSAPRGAVAWDEKRQSGRRSYVGRPSLLLLARSSEAQKTSPIRAPRLDSGTCRDIRVVLTRCVLLDARRRWSATQLPHGSELTSSTCVCRRYAIRRLRAPAEYTEVAGSSSRGWRDPLRPSKKILARRASEEAAPVRA